MSPEDKLNKQEKVESNLSEDESTIFRAEAPSPEAAEKLAADLERAGVIIAETSDEFRKMAATSETIKGKVESGPQTEAEKLIVEKIGYSTEDIARLKEGFSKLSSVEAYNKFQKLSLQAVEDFFVTSGQNLKPSEKGAVKSLMKNIDVALSAADKDEAAAAKNNSSQKAVRSFSTIMKNSNVGADGVTIFGGMGNLLAKTGFDDRNAIVRAFGSSSVGLENFQNTLAESILTKKQAEDIKKMSKAAEKGTSSAGGGKNSSGTVRTVGFESALSSRTVDELLEKAA